MTGIRMKSHLPAPAYSIDFLSAEAVRLTAPALYKAAFSPLANLTKTVSPSELLVGSTATYTLTALASPATADTSPGNVDTLPLSNLVITDTIPSNFRIDQVPANCTAAGQQVSCQISSLAVNAQSSFDIGVTLIQADPSGKVLNTANLVSDNASNCTSSTPCQAQAEVKTLEPKVQISESISPPTDTNGDGLVGAGDTVHYTFTVTNTGTAPLQTVVLQDGVLQNIICPSSSLPLTVGAQIICTGDVTVTPAQVTAGNIANTVQVTGRDANGNPATDTTQGVVDLPPLPKPKIKITEKIRPLSDTNKDGKIGVGDTVFYDFVVTNVGVTTVLNLTIQDNIVQNIVCQPATPAELLVNAEMTCQGNLVITADQMKAGFIENQVSAQGKDIYATPTNDFTLGKVDLSTKTESIPTLHPLTLLLLSAFMAVLGIPRKKALV